MLFKLPHASLRRATLGMATRVAACLAVLGPLQAQAADSASGQIAAWVASARAADPAFAASAERGKAFYGKASAHNADMASCSACHTANPATAGKHVVTGKGIAALAPGANAERFADAAKTEKWFKRNCNDVLGRACSSAEKADFVTYLLSAR